LATSRIRPQITEMIANARLVRSPSAQLLSRANSVSPTVLVNETQPKIRMYVPVSPASVR
jgi:hypothetical protein